MALAMTHGEDLDAVVGAGPSAMTAEAVPRDPAIGRTCTVVEVIPEVIQWHRDHLLPARQARRR